MQYDLCLKYYLCTEFHCTSSTLAHWKLLIWNNMSIVGQCLGLYGVMVQVHQSNQFWLQRRANRQHTDLHTWCICLNLHGPCFYTETSRPHQASIVHNCCIKHLRSAANKFCGKTESPLERSPHDNITVQCKRSVRSKIQDNSRVAGQWKDKLGHRVLNL